MARNNRQDRARERALLSMQRALGVVQKQIEELMLKLPSEDGMLDSTAISLQNTTRIRSQIIATMQRQGAKVVSSAADDALADAAAFAVNDLDLGEFKADVSKDLERILSPRVEEITKEVTGRGRVMADLVRQRMASGASVSRLLEDASKQFQTAQSQIETVVDTAVSAVYVDANVERHTIDQEELGEPALFQYLGPASGDVLRPWCAKLVTSTTKQVYTREAIDKMKPAEGQPGPVRAYCGGYNCRHEWSPIDAETVAERGYKIVR